MIYFSIFLGFAIIHPTGSSPCPYGPNEKRVAYNSCAREARRVLAWLWIEVGTRNNEKGYPPAIKHGWLDLPPVMKSGIRDFPASRLRLQVQIRPKSVVGLKF